MAEQLGYWISWQLKTDAQMKLVLSTGLTNVLAWEMRPTLRIVPAVNSIALRQVSREKSRPWAGAVHESEAYFLAMIEKR